jgi:uncharacterized protein YndB with AHSA1/START domain
MKRKAVKRVARKRAVAGKAALKPQRREVEEKRTIQAKPEAVFRALSQAYEWQLWFCQEAKFEARPREKWEAKWEDGYSAAGVFTVLDPGKKVTFTWEDALNPKPTKVEFKLQPVGSGTVLTLKHTGFVPGPKGTKALAMARQAWSPCLENLQSILETGIDLRLARRPMMGIGFDVLSPESAKGLGAKPGNLKLTGVVPGLSAEKAGLRTGDVLVTLDKREVTDPGKLIAVLGKHTAGDKIEVTFLRDKMKQSAVLELSPRKMPVVPWDPKQVVARAREAYKPVWEEMEKAFSGVTEEEASTPEAPDKWSVKQVLAHLSVSERDNHQWMIWDILGEIPNTRENPTTAPERLKAAVAAAPTLPELFARYKKDAEESWNILLALRPEVLENKARYRRIAQGILDYAEHAKGHLGQIKRVLAAVRKT